MFLLLFLSSKQIFKNGVLIASELLKFCCVPTPTPTDSLIECCITIKLIEAKNDTFKCVSDKTINLGEVERVNLKQRKCEKSYKVVDPDSEVSKKGELIRNCESTETRGLS
jgi:hypothetical protein